jgi:hypothetical protein
LRFWRASLRASGQTLDRLLLHKVRAAEAEYRGTEAVHIM